MTKPRPVRRREIAGASVLEFADDQTACRAAASRIAETIRSSLAAKGRAILGLATGSTPEPVYGRLVSFHKEGALAFANVSTYNLDEYYPMGPLDPNSYRSYMHRHLFGHVDLALALRTRMIDLHPTTIADAVRDFGGPDRVPRRALTMGIATILAARSILVLAFGAHKAGAVARSLRGPITAEVPGSLLQTIPGKVTWIIDRAAASEIL